MKLEGIILSEISQSKKILYDTTYVWNLQKPSSRETKNGGYQVLGAEEVGRYQSQGTNFEHKINKFWGSKVQQGDDSSPYCIMHVKVAKRVNLKSPQHKKEVIIH